MTNADRVRTVLRELADEIEAEQNLEQAADMTGEFRRVSGELSRELLGKVGYQMRDRRWNLSDMAEILHARRETINAAVMAHATRMGLPTPRGFRRSKVEKVVRLPGGKGEQRPQEPRSPR